MPQYGYDAVGLLTLITDADNRRVGTVYDLGGQPLCTWKGWNSTIAPTSCAWSPSSYAAAGNNGPLRYVEYTYTANSKLSSVKDANNNVTKYVYDNLDRVRYTFFPNASDGTSCTLSGGVEGAAPVCTASSGTTPTYEDLWYTVDGTPTGLLCSGDVQVCRKRTRAGDAITYTYDKANRLATKSVTGLPTVTYNYTLLHEPLSLTSPALGSIPAHGIGYDYDHAGRKSFEENLLGSVYQRVTYGYDKAGNRTRTTWPDNYIVSYEYDALNRMSKVWEGVPNTGVKLADYTHDALSRRQSLRFADSVTNETTYAYELDSQLDVLTHSLKVGQGFSLNYGHNNSGQITTIVSSDDFFLPAPIASSTLAYVPNRLDQYSSFAGQSLTYDDNGNLLTWFPTGGKHSYVYDAENRLRTAAINGSATPTITYDYDPLGRRLSKNDNGTRTGYLLDGDEEIAEYSIDAAGVWATTPLRRYVTGPAIDERIASIDAVNGTRNYYYINHQGSVLAMTNSTGDTTCTGCQRLSYDEYGNLGAGSATTGQPYRYTGRRFDAETGLYYYRARYYSPVLGRFLQTDPVGYQDDFNVYAYVRNDPLNNTDPTGMYESHWLLRALVPGQVTFDNAMTAIENGGSTQGAALMGAMVGEQILTVASLGTASAAAPALRTVETAAASASEMNASRGLSARMGGIVFHGHHPIPKVLGGPSDQALETLTTGMHRKFHSMLEASLKKDGFDLPIGGKRGSAQVWSRYFSENPGSQNRAQKIVRQTSKQFDKQYGTDLAGAVKQMCTGSRIAGTSC